MSLPTLPRIPAAVIFDMDGLLFDTEKVSGQALLSAAAELGFEVSLDLFHRFIGANWTENRRQMLLHFGDAFPADELREVWRRHFHLLLDAGLEMKPGVIELLQSLDDWSLPRAIATSSSHPTVQRHLTTHDLGDRFHAIVAAGDYAASKPAPDPFLAAADRLQVSPGMCLALEDSHNGVRSAAAAGMMTIMVPDLMAPTDEIRRLCTHVATDLYEVRALLHARLGTS